jgi:hypothetical protein
MLFTSMASAVVWLLCVLRTDGDKVSWIRGFDGVWVVFGWYLGGDSK